MGILRLFLSINVVGSHSSSPIFPWVAQNGREAVQIFFIVSGFYMALIAGKYSSAKEFYANRFLRIFIPYWLILIIVLLVSFVGGVWFGVWGELSSYMDNPLQKNGLLGVLYVAISNITLFLQDTSLFLAHDANDIFRFTVNFRDSQTPLWYYLIIPQAWSVSLELYFYLLVPFLARLKTRYLLAIMCFSLLLRVFAYEYLELNKDPWDNRFFPFELALFLMGMISYRLYHRYHHFFLTHLGRFAVDRKGKYPVYFIFALFLFFLAKRLQLFLLHWVGDNYSALIIYFVWAGIVPILFFVCKESSWDRLIGELSYPVYLVHYFVILIVHQIQWVMEISMDKLWLGRVNAFFSILIAILLMKIILVPFENKRHLLARQIIKKPVERPGEVLQ